MTRWSSRRGCFFCLVVCMRGVCGGLGASTHLAFPWAASALVAQENTFSIREQSGSQAGTHSGRHAGTQAPSERDWNVMRDLAIIVNDSSFTCYLAVLLYYVRGGKG